MKSKTFFEHKEAIEILEKAQTELEDKGYKVFFTKTQRTVELTAPYADTLFKMELQASKQWEN